MLIGGVIGSAALYLGFKNRPGAYQGSPSFYMDPSRNRSRLRVGNRNPERLDRAAGDNQFQAALIMYGASLEKLLDGYYLLDRNYNYHFHNELFVRSTPLVPSYPIGWTWLDRGSATGTAAR